MSEATTSTPGRNNEVSTANIRHSGRKIRPACGAASNSSTISGCPRIVRSCEPYPAA